MAPNPGMKKIIKPQGKEPAGLRRMDDQRHLDQQQDQSKLHGSLSAAAGETLTPPA
jgi:hypothetical protein